MFNALQIKYISNGALTCTTLFMNTEIRACECVCMCVCVCVCVYACHTVIIFGTVSAKIAPRLKCYKNASRLNRYNFPTDNAIDFLFSTLHTTPCYYEVQKIVSQ